MKTIQINHIAKTEGHMSFVGALIDGDFAQARIETEEGARLLEGVLLNRQYYEAPIVTARICGVCPIVHNLCSIKAIECHSHKRNSSIEKNAVERPMDPQPCLARVFPVIPGHRRHFQ
jgi:Ni,Fe-hydrogenase I large subunit